MKGSENQIETLLVVWGPLNAHLISRLTFQHFRDARCLHTDFISKRHYIVGMTAILSFVP